MSSRIARVVKILTLLATAIFLVISAMPVCRTGSAHAAYHESAANITPTISTDNQTTQDTEEEIEQSGKQAELSNTVSSSLNKKLDPGDTEKISTMKPTDDIWLTVKFIIYEAITPTGKIIRAMTPEAWTRVAVAIEALPDTRIINGTENGMLVQTKVGNIEALTEMPEIAGITDISSSNPPVHSNINTQLLSPNNLSLDCPVDRPSFSWSPTKDVTTKFKFVLAKDAAMTQVVKEAEVTGTRYDYDGKLDYGTNYYWRVMAVEVIPRDWSATFSFQTEAAPPPRESEAQSVAWHKALIAIIIVVVIAASAGPISWFILVKQRQTKRKSG
jgi:hypothetical protein